MRFEESIVFKKGDMFVVRCYFLMEIIGGGVIIDLFFKKYKKFDEKVIEVLKIKEKGELKDIIEEYLKRNLKNYLNIKEIMSYSGVYEEDVKRVFEIFILEDKVFIIGNMYMYIN